MRTCAGVALMSVGPYALAALLAGAACTSALAQDDGFGNGVPLSAAAKGIVPKGYTVDLGKGVDGSVDVSWHGGDWHRKLDEAVSGAGYAARVDGQVVHITRKGANLAEVSQKAPEAADPLDATRAAMPRHAAHAPAGEPAARRRAEPLARHERAEPRRAEPVRHALARRAEPREPEADVGPAYGPTVSASGFVLMPKREPPRVAVAEAGGDDGWKPVSRRRAPAPAPRVDAPEPARAAVPAAGFVAEKDQNLASVLQEWAAREGWHVEWKSEYQYRLRASARYPGGFVEASSELVRSMADARPQPTAEFFKGNKTLVIDNTGRSETAAATE